MLTETIIAQLEKEVLRGVYPAGSKIPSERDLAEKFNVSRNTIRESVAKLVNLGLLKTVPQSGTYVTDYQTSASLDLLIHMMNSRSLLDRDILECLLEFRRLTTVFAVGKAAVLATPAALADFAALVENEERHSHQAEIVADCDYRIHHLIFTIADNLALQLTFNSYKPLYRLYTELFFSLPNAAVVTIEQHQRLLAAFVDRDSDLAARIMEEALIYGEKRILAVLEEGGKFPCRNQN